MVESDNGGGFTVAGDEEEKSRPRDLVTNDMGQGAMMVTSEVLHMIPSLEKVESNNYEMNAYINIENGHIEKNEEVHKLNNSQMVGIEDDKCTQEVMRDLGLIQSGLEGNNLIAKAY